ncbi:MAG TPA: YihY/virulence factor BrkB family protein [Acetobacteraceae bacterium]|nr:YihY/virulence factor BrkB family protein [Acetobacteraceae bacterium]
MAEPASQQRTDGQSPDAREVRRQPRNGWRRMAMSAFEALVSDRGSIAAAGCAFYATLALFPAITTLVSLYGLAFNRANVESQLLYLHGLLPSPAFELIADRVHDLVTQPSGQLGLRLLVSSLVTFWSAAAGTKSMLSALNVAYNVEEQRSFLRFQAVALGTTLAAMMAAVLGISVLVFMPVVLSFIGLKAHAGVLIHAVGMLMLVAFVAISVAVLYRIGPSRRRKAVQRIAPGTAVATLIWLVASSLLTLYVANLATFGATYGSIAAVVGVMLWFYLSVYAVLLGAELNSQLERKAAEANALDDAPRD